MTEKYRLPIADRARRSAFAGCCAGLILIAMLWIISMMWEPVNFQMENGRVTKCLLIRRGPADPWRAFCLAPEVEQVKNTHNTFRIKKGK